LSIYSHQGKTLQVICASFYHLASPALAAQAREAAIYKEVKFSDHAPLTIAYAWRCDTVAVCGGYHCPIRI
jgi:exodeoxyribonuclease-3